MTTQTPRASPLLGFRSGFQLRVLPATESPSTSSEVFEVIEGFSGYDPRGANFFAGDIKSDDLVETTGLRHYRRARTHHMGCTHPSHTMHQSSSKISKFIIIPVSECPKMWQWATAEATYTPDAVKRKRLHEGKKATQGKE